MTNIYARAPAALLALMFVLLSVLSVSAEGGNGDGTGDGGGRETPLTLVSSSVLNGAENVDANVHIVLKFSKNVVHFNVKANNQKCFSVTDSKGNSFPITPEMGDDQVDPDIKRIVTIVPKSPYKAGETYLLTVKHGLTAKNEENILEKDVLISFTIAGSSDSSPTTITTTTTTSVRTTTANTSANSYIYAADTQDTITTTTEAIKASTTASASGKTTKPVISAAADSSAKTEKTTKQIAQTSSATTKPVTSVTASRSTETTENSLSTTVTVSPNLTEANTETLPQSEPDTSEESTAAAAAKFATAEPETTASETIAEEASSGNEKRSPRVMFIGIITALAATAVAVIGIVYQKKKKG